ncbi:MAG: ISAzo13 family transposase [Anaerolineales bacterium]
MKSLVESETGGDPMSERKWVRSSLRHLQEKLEGQVSHTTIGRLLREMDYSLKVNVKRLTGDPHPDREQQFTYIESQKQAFLQAGWPVISVDSKKKELIGNFKNAGQRWCLEAEPVNEHDFKQDALGKAVPYGLYNLNHHLGWVYVGQSADTPQFAVEAIAQWWQTIGRELFPTAPQLLILGDAGGSNGYRPRLWKQQLQEQLADRLRLAVTVCHYPTGASKWNPVEHRLFGPISVNWAGIPLRTFQTMLALIRGTTNQSGLKVEAFLVDKVYQKGLKVADEVMENLNIERHTTCPKWNYTIRPRWTASVCT